MGRGGRNWLGESGGAEVGGDQATAYSDLEGRNRGWSKTPLCADK